MRVGFTSRNKSVLLVALHWCHATYYIIEPEGLRFISASFLMVLSVRSQRGELCDCKFNGSCFPLGDVIPTSCHGYRIAINSRGAAVHDTASAHATATP